MAATLLRRTAVAALGGCLLLGLLPQTGWAARRTKIAATIADVQQAEGDSGTTAFTFTVTLARPAASKAKINYATAPGSAEPTDFAASSGTLQVPVGATQATIDVAVNGDTQEETDERFFVYLSGGGKAVRVTDSEGVGTILNDDLGSGTPAEDDKAATATTLRISKRPARVVAQGRLTPPAPAEKMIVKLFRKRSGRWVLLRTKRPALSAAKVVGGVARSTYRTAFARPNKAGTFKIVARYAGNAEHLASKATRRFRLG